MIRSAMEITLLLSMLLVIASAKPRFIAIPLEDIEVIRMEASPQQRASVRLPRGAWDQDQTQEGDGRVERQAHGHHEHVDYGAHTGHHGAFGWYADFPVTTHH